MTMDPKTLDICLRLVRKELRHAEREIAELVSEGRTSSQQLQDWNQRRDNLLDAHDEISELLHHKREKVRR